MRKITQAAAAAFSHYNAFNRDNTCVTVDLTAVRMYLHGNQIAQMSDCGPAVVYVSLAGWGTPTTRERVNGLLQTLDSRCGYYQRNHKQWFSTANGDIEVDPSDVIEVDLNNGDAHIVR